MDGAAAFRAHIQRVFVHIHFYELFPHLGVNAAALREYGFRRRAPGAARWWLDFAIPTLGFIFCLVIWLNLSRPAQVIGGIWLLAGIVYLMILTRGFRGLPASLDFAEDTAGPRSEAASGQPSPLIVRP